MRCLEGYLDGMHLHGLIRMQHDRRVDLADAFADVGLPNGAEQRDSAVDGGESTTARDRNDYALRFDRYRHYYIVSRGLNKRPPFDVP
jgi:hypothetical protein